MSGKFQNTLAVTNAIIGLAHHDGQWPDDLHALGYAVYRIERVLETKEGRYRADVILQSTSRNSVLVVEVKCANNVQGDQHRSVLAVDSSCLRAAGIPSRDWESFLSDCTYCTTDDYAARINVGLDRLGDVPLVVFSDALIQLTRMRLRDAELDSVLRTGIDVDGMNPPMGYVPFDRETSELGIARHLIPAILSCLRRGEVSLPIDEFISLVYPMWMRLDQGYRAELTRTVVKVLRRGLQEGLDRYLVIKADEAPTQIQFLRGFAGLSPDDMRKEIARWDATCRGFLVALGAPPDQLSFDDIPGN